MAENEFPAIPGPVCEKTAFREVNPHILCSPFIRASWQPLTDDLPARQNSIGLAGIKALTPVVQADGLAPTVRRLLEG